MPANIPRYCYSRPGDYPDCELQPMLNDPEWNCCDLPANPTVTAEPSGARAAANGMTVSARVLELRLRLPANDLENVA